MNSGHAARIRSPNSTASQSIATREPWRAASRRESSNEKSVAIVVPADAGDLEGVEGRKVVVACPPSERERTRRGRSGGRGAARRDGERAASGDTREGRAPPRAGGSARSRCAARTRAASRRRRSASRAPGRRWRASSRLRRRDVGAARHGRDATSGYARAPGGMMPSRLFRVARPRTGSRASPPRRAPAPRRARRRPGPAAPRSAAPAPPAAAAPAPSPRRRRPAPVGRQQLAAGHALFGEGRRSARRRREGAHDQGRPDARAG